MDQAPEAPADSGARPQVIKHSDLNFRAAPRLLLDLLVDSRALEQADVPRAHWCLS